LKIEVWKLKDLSTNYKDKKTEKYIPLFINKTIRLIRVIR